MVDVYQADELQAGRRRAIRVLLVAMLMRDMIRESLFSEKEIRDFFRDRFTDEYKEACAELRRMQRNED